MGRSGKAWAGGKHGTRPFHMQFTHLHCMNFSVAGFINRFGQQVLSDCVVAIREKFMKCVETFKAVSYDIMDVGEIQFEHDYFKFRMTVKDLDRRLGSPSCICI